MDTKNNKPFESYPFTHHKLKEVKHTYHIINKDGTFIDIEADSAVEAIEKCPDCKIEKITNDTTKNNIISSSIIE